MAATNEHMAVSLVFFSTFEPITLIPDSCMQKKGVPILYEQAAAQVPTLYVCPVKNVLGSVHLIPCYLNGNIMNSIPHTYRSRIPREAFEVNIWLWYGRPFRVRSLWSKRWNCERRGFRTPGQEALKQYAAETRLPEHTLREN
jgi:hypothetical protein